MTNEMLTNGDFRYLCVNDVSTLEVGSRVLTPSSIECKVVELHNGRGHNSEVAVVRQIDDGVVCGKRTTAYYTKFLTAI